MSADMGGSLAVSGSVRARGIPADSQSEAAGAVMTGGWVRATLDGDGLRVDVFAQAEYGASVRRTVTVSHQIADPPSMLAALLAELLATERPALARAAAVAAARAQIAAFDAGEEN